MVILPLFFTSDGKKKIIMNKWFKAKKLTLSLELDLRLFVIKAHQVN